jgi:hypothetical protein
MKVSAGGGPLALHTGHTYDMFLAQPSALAGVAEQNHPPMTVPRSPWVN